MKGEEIFFKKRSEGVDKAVGFVYIIIQNS